jgi:hypothetical protein
MKFYRDKEDLNSIYIIEIFKLTCVYSSYNYVEFLKNGKGHNIKNADFIRYDGYKQFCLNDKYFGNQYNFTKKSWRRFVKLKIFE